MDSGKRLDFFLPCKVGQKGNNKKIVKFGSRFGLIAKDSDRAAEQSLIARLCEFRPAAPFTGPVRLAVGFVRKVPDGWPKWKRAAALAGRFHPVSAPDRGNSLKLIEDALEGAFYDNDSHVVTGEVAKLYGEIPGYRIVLVELQQATRESESARARAT